MKLGGSKFVCTDLTILLSTAPSLLLLLQLIPSELAIKHFSRHQRVVVLLDLRLGAGFSENCQQNMID